MFRCTIVIQIKFCLKLCRKFSIFRSDLLNITVMTEFAKENVGTLLSLLESLWNLLKGNLGLIFQFLFASLSLVLGGGTVVLNFFISTIVFFTALFYLLSSSGARYKPVEWLSNISPISGSQ